ncbi:MAG: MBL fold metallo-hydrolase [Actinobacteria bacterium]|nr:MBL fold metallo-hydrolase [Actinomycetota bacterium]
MARIDHRDPRNAHGAWFVDTRCIDCGTCRELIPELFASVGDQSVVRVQPSGAEGEHRAWLAAEACPTRSIGRAPRSSRPPGLYPLAVDGPVHDLGYTSEASFGATSYLVVRPDGNLMIDAPRFTRLLASPLDDLGGVAHVLLTHRDDVADAPAWAERYGARVWIHEADGSAAPGATDLLEGDEPTVVASGVVAIPVPGHTRGSVAFAVDDTWLFSGDSLAWSHRSQDLIAFRDACWYSWAEQTRSLARLAEVTSFSWVLPGHGARIRLEPDDAHRRLVRLVERMKAAA